MARLSREAANVKLAKQLVYLSAAISLVAALALWFSGNREHGQFVGLWVPSILALGAMLFGGRSAAI